MEDVQIRLISEIPKGFSDCFLRSNNIIVEIQRFKDDKNLLSNIPYECMLSKIEEWGNDKLYVFSILGLKNPLSLTIHEDLMVEIINKTIK